MSDANNKQRRVRGRIRVGEDYEVRCWTEKLGVDNRDMGR
jgi:hypothetical protein